MCAGAGNTRRHHAWLCFCRGPLQRMRERMRARRHNARQGRCLTRPWDTVPPWPKGRLCSAARPASHKTGHCVIASRRLLQSVRLSAYPSVRLSVCLSVCLPVCHGTLMPRNFARSSAPARSKSVNKLTCLNAVSIGASGGGSESSGVALRGPAGPGSALEPRGPPCTNASARAPQAKRQPGLPLR